MEKKQPVPFQPIPKAHWFQSADEIKRCKCHNRPVWMCPTYKRGNGNYLWFRDLEVKSLDMGMIAFA